MARFSFHRGSLALDFAGTVGRRSSSPEERLPDVDAFAAWLREAALLDGSDRPTAADLDAAIALREAIARASAACAAGRTPLRRDVEIVNAAAARAPVATLDARTLALRWDAAHPVRAALARVAADAIDLLATRRTRLVRCSLDGCGALLLSASRGAPRRWCSMQTCGNVAKAAAHRARLRSARTSAP